MGFWDDVKKATEESKEELKIKQSFEYRTAKHKEKLGLKKDIRQENKDRLKRMKKEGVAFCPKCKGTSVQYVERRKMLSLGRAVTGGVLLGEIGAGVGAMTSKKHKGFVKCLNCGHKWKK